MPAEPPQYQQQYTRQRRRRRRPLETSCSQLIFLVGVAVVGGRTATAFVPPPQALRHSSVPHAAAASQQSAHVAAAAAAAKGGAARRSRMVLADSPSAACRRALQRAWEASPKETPMQHRETLPPVTPETAAGEEGERERGMDFRLTTFNLLAPCYKRMHDREVAPHVAATGLLANRARTERTARESEFDGVWRERALETVNFIRREMSSSDIICLQEFWLDPSYDSIFRSVLEEDYDFHTVRRTGGKADGVAVLLRRGMFEVCSELGLSLSSVGDRVALIMHLRSRRGPRPLIEPAAPAAAAGAAGEVVAAEAPPAASGAAAAAAAAAAASDGGGGAGVGEGVGEDMILVNTHLAFPHHALDRMNQMSQIQTVTDTVERVIEDAGLPTTTPRVVVGDLNVEETDPVCRHLSKNGFRSAFTALHRQKRVITHRNHRGEEVMVDHVFVKAPGVAGRRRGDSVAAAAAAPQIPGLVAKLHEDVSVEEALLLPGSIATAKWSPLFSLSDHRPLTVRLKFPAE